MNKGIAIGIIAAIAIGIGAGFAIFSDSSDPTSEIVNIEPGENQEPESAEKKSFKIELEENMSIEGKP